MKSRTDILIDYITELAEDAESNKDVRLAQTLDVVTTDLLERHAEFFTPQFFLHLITFSWRFALYVVTRYIPNFAFHMVPPFYHYIATYIGTGQRLSLDVLGSAAMRSVAKAYDDTTLSTPAKTIFTKTMEGQDFSAGDYLSPSGQLKKDVVREMLSEQGLSKAEQRKYLSDPVIQKMFQETVKRHLKETGQLRGKNDLSGLRPPRTAAVVTAAKLNIARAAVKKVQEFISERWMKSLLRKHLDKILVFVERKDQKGLTRFMTSKLRKIAKSDPDFKRELLLAAKKAS